MSVTVNLYVVGQVVRASVTLRNTATDALTDPSSLTFIILHPDLTEDVYVYGVDAQPIRDSIGMYHVDFLVDDGGTWIYRYESTGTAAGAGEKTISVNHSRIPSEQT